MERQFPLAGPDYRGKRKLDFGFQRILDVFDTERIAALDSLRRSPNP